VKNPVSFLKILFFDLWKSKSNFVDNSSAPESENIPERPPSGDGEHLTNLERQCESLQFEIELKNTSLSKLQTSLNQVLLRNEKLDRT